MTRITRALALTVVLAFAFVGCAQPIKETGAKKSPPRTAKKPGEPGATQPSAPPSSADKAEQPKPTKPGAEAIAPRKPGTRPGTQPPRPPEFERPVSKDIDATKVGIPIYPGAEVASAQEWTWPTGERGTQRTARLTSTDDPEKIIKWYHTKLGAKAETHRKDTNGNRKVAWIYFSEPALRVIRTVSVSWTEATAGEPTDVTIYLTHRKWAARTGK